MCSARAAVEIDAPGTLPTIGRHVHSPSREWLREGSDHVVSTSLGQFVDRVATACNATGDGPSVVCRLEVARRVSHDEHL